MGRVHLFEFEDQSWFPVLLRNYMTDFLQFGANKFDIYKAIIPIIEKRLSKSNSNTIIDLGSGGGGGLIKLSEHLTKNNPDLKITLTDYYPNIDAFIHTQKQNPCFNYIEEPIDAMNVPENLKGLRTMFLSLHHFKPNDAKKILQNAMNSNSSIAVFEAQERSLPSILAMFFSPLTVLFMTPFIRPFKIGRILFTYLIPLVPVFVWWDGIVSALRTYSVKEMNILVNELDNKDLFEWEIKKIKSGPGIIQYLLGTRKK